ncbi:hypothetical protein TNCV_2748301 [Trichonephila clavipes]|nr:hypothetical protein TNCV_2748301 [Trichonephila clavipes]
MLAQRFPKRISEKTHIDSSQLYTLVPTHSNGLSLQLTSRLAWTLSSTSISSKRSLSQEWPGRNSDLNKQRSFLAPFSLFNSIAYKFQDFGS